MCKEHAAPVVTTIDAMIYLGPSASCAECYKALRVAPQSEPLTTTPHIQDVSAYAWQGARVRTSK